MNLLAAVSTTGPLAVCVRKLVMKLFGVSCPECCELRSTRCEVCVARCVLRVASCVLPVASCELRVALLRGLWCLVRKQVRLEKGQRAVGWNLVF